MQKLAFSYLSRANSLPDIDPPLGLPERWLQALDPARDPDPAFGWLPIGWPPKDKVSADPLVSFLVERRSASGALLPDQTVILLASERLGSIFLGSGFGIRIVAHAHALQTDNKSEVRITGLSASLPFGLYRTAGALSEGANAFLSKVLTANKTETDQTKIENALGLQKVRFRGCRLARIERNNWRVEWHGTGSAKTTASSSSMPYSFVYVETISDAEDLVRKAISVSKVVLVADATAGHALVFPRDPVSQGGPQDLHKRRPTRSEKELDIFCLDEEITAGRTDPLIYPRPPKTPEDMRVVVCPGFVADDAGATPKTVDLPGIGPPIRSNDFAAVMAFKNVKQLFERLDAYGLSPDAYFRIAKLPLKIAYRFGVRPGPGKDGQTVNARVLAEGWPVDFVGPTPPGQRPGLEIHLALANLSHRARKPWDRKDRSPAEPLGIAADARWIWHEIGHVLLMASVGELEFRFAHSPGDALAAIVADPQSKLVADANWRGATFPWVFIPRRHDRCVSLGWSWGGSLHHALALVPSTALPRRKGYWTEQILSSSLFRLYRCLGGQTPQVGLPTTPYQKMSRESASHYSVYLIMRAIQIMGSSGIVPTNDPDQFISALIDADIGTGEWTVTFPPLSFTRVGGCTHKVIRWAFEAQGMYTAAGTITNAPGLPPPVDVYIKDLRPTVDSTPYCYIQYGLGSYVPVSLDWDQGQSDKPPAWQADPDAIAVSDSNIYVKVGNRGNQPADDVKVSVWWRKWPNNTAPPEWYNGLGWTPGSPSVSVGQTIEPGASVTFGPFSHVPPGERYLVLAQATCGDDPANTDSATSLPCSHLKTSLIELVAGDNNLGLRVIKNP